MAFPANTLQRRVHCGPTIQYIAEHRDRHFQNLSLDRLIPLAVYVTVRDLKVWNVQLIAGAACEKHRTDGSDLFDDWQKYCKHLGGQQQAFALLEGAVYFAAQLIPEPQRQGWIDECSRQLHAFKELTPDSGARTRTGLKRKRGKDDTVKFRAGQTSSCTPRETTTSLDGAFMPWAPLAPTVGVGVVVAKVATIEKIKTIVGTYIFAGIKASNTRKQEHGSDVIGLEAIWIGLDLSENGWTGFGFLEDLDWIGLIGNQLLELQWSNLIRQELSLIEWS